MELWSHGKPWFVGIYRESFIPGFVRRREMDFVHPQCGVKSLHEMKPVKPHKPWMVFVVVHVVLQ